MVARALRSKTSEHVLEDLQDIYLDVGLPNVIQNEQRKEFTSKVSQVCSLLSIVLFLTCSLDIPGFPPKAENRQP